MPFLSRVAVLVALLLVPALLALAGELLVAPETVPEAPEGPVVLGG